MKILVVNCGSSSLKYKLFDMAKEEAVFSGHIDGIGLERCKVVIKYSDKKLENSHFFKDHVDAVLFAINSLKHYKVISNLSEITCVAHRVVHGGESYSKSVVINSAVIKTIAKLSELAPLHNPANLAGIIACQKLLPKVKHVAVFDTAFHQTMPEKNYTYALPYHFYKEHAIRRYGFHGISHKYVSMQAVKFLGKSHSKIIICHLGNGGSVTAVVDGKSFITSMGFTPLEGLVMGTRAGDFDPAILIYMNAHKEFHIKDLNEFVNKKSGLLGISGTTSDMRDLKKKIDSGDARAKLAMDVYCSRIAFYIGGYTSLMNGVDAIVFTAGIGEGAWYVRKQVCENLKHLGVDLDLKLNRMGKVLISKKSSDVNVYVIPTNEELQMAREAKGLV